MKQSLLILVSITVGTLLPYGHQFVYLIKYTLMTMLFFAFLNIRFQPSMLRKAHLYLLAVNVIIPLVLYVIIKPFDHTMALLAFVLGICPTAAAAPVVGQFMRTDITFITTSVLLTNPFVAVIIPLILPSLLPVTTEISTMDVLLPVLMVVGIPLVLSFLIKNVSSAATDYLLRFKMISFYLFLLNVWIGSGKATHFILHENTHAIEVILSTAAVTAAICLIQFQTGMRLHLGNAPLASGLALGRKNTMFGLWLALTFIEPVVAMGPIFYILFQNLFNTYQIYLVEKKLVKT